MGTFFSTEKHQKHTKMPPKKKVAEEVLIPLGRPGNTLKMGIVGLPNVGKSSTFNLMSKLQAPAENIPFCTIDPNIAKVPIPDARYEKLVAHCRYCWISIWSFYRRRYGQPLLIKY